MEREFNQQCEVSEVETANAFESLKAIVMNPIEPPMIVDPGLTVVKPASQWASEAALTPKPKSLWPDLWNEGEVCCLFADSNLGKSIYAVQIGLEIAKSQKVIYFDFELSPKQFQQRYSSADGRIYDFPSTFYRGEIDDFDYYGNNFESDIIQSIEYQALTVGAKVLIIDNLTWLCSESEKGSTAGQLMQELVRLKKQYGWSLLVISHTPKRCLTSPLTQNDLTGSKRLFNFFDSVFAIGRSAKDPNLRYIKQLKYRAGEFTYDRNNVIVCDIIKDDALIYLHQICLGRESDHLSDGTEDIESQIKKLKSEGWNAKEIVEITGLSQATVYRNLKK